MSRTLVKFGVPFDKATPLVHFLKRLKRPRNTAGPASQYEDRQWDRERMGDIIHMPDNKSGTS